MGQEGETSGYRIARRKGKCRQASGRLQRGVYWFVGLADETPSHLDAQAEGKRGDGAGGCFQDAALGGDFGHLEFLFGRREAVKSRAVEAEKVFEERQAIVGAEVNAGFFEGHGIDLGSTAASETTGGATAGCRFCGVGCAVGASEEFGLP